MSSKRYYPNLLPAGQRILPDYFNGEPYSSSEQSGLKGLSVATGILLLIISPFALAYLPFLATLIVTGLLLLPRITKLVTRACQIRLTASVRKTALIALLVLNLPFAVAFGKVEVRLAEDHRTEQLREQQAARQAERKERQRKDSLDVGLQRIADFHQQGETDKALIALDKVDLLAKTPSESADVNQKRVEVSLTKATQLMDKRQYNMAIDLLTDAYELDSTDAEVLYHRAICYVKTKQIPYAVHDAKKAMFHGHVAADTLYEQINPVRKRIAYSTTQCRDGSFSSATGRGACSHHGGVANWNYPVYEIYRQYE